MLKQEFHHKLRDQVRMIHSEEEGEVIGRAEYTDAEPGYLVRYRAADGRQVESWWGQSAVIAP